MIEGEAAHGKPGAPQSQRQERRWRIAMVVGLVFLVVATCAVSAYVVVEGRAGLYREDGRLVTVQDFASHARFSRAVWAGDFAASDSSLYTVDAHLRFMRDWAGEPVDRALPFGYSPSMVWVLGPFAAFPLPVGYLLWTLAGLAGAVWIIRHPRVQGPLAIIALLTPVGAASVALGQTALLALGGLFFLMDRSLRQGERPFDAKAAVALAVVLWALGGKPPLAVTAGVALIALRHTGVVTLGVALTLVSTVALLPWIGVEWPADYLAMISTYNRTEADAAFAWSLVPSLMTNVRATAYVDLGVPDVAAARIGNLLWIASLAGILWAGRAGRLTAGGIWALAALAYLLFCSHVSFTEDLLLLVAPAAVTSWGVRTVRWQNTAWTLVPVGLVLNSALGPAAGLRPPPLMAVKLLLVAWVLHETVRGRASADEGRESTASGTTAVREGAG